jgi:hypothetical protein
MLSKISQTSRCNCVLHITTFEGITKRILRHRWCVSDGSFRIFARHVVLLFPHNRFVVIQLLQPAYRKPPVDIPGQRRCCCWLLALALVFAYVMCCCCCWLFGREPAQIVGLLGADSFLQDLYHVSQLHPRQTMFQSRVLSNDAVKEGGFDVQRRQPVVVDVVIVVIFVALDLATTLFFQKLLPKTFVVSLGAVAKDPIGDPPRGKHERNDQHRCGGSPFRDWLLLYLYLLFFLLLLFLFSFSLGRWSSVSRSREVPLLLLPKTTGTDACIRIRIRIRIRMHATISKGPREGSVPVPANRRESGVGGANRIGTTETSP